MLHLLPHEHEAYLNTTSKVALKETKAIQHRDEMMWKLMPAAVYLCMIAKSEGSVNAVVNCNLYAVFKQRVEFDEEIK